MAYVYWVTSDSSEPAEWRICVRRERTNQASWEIDEPPAFEVPADIRAALRLWLESVP